MKRILSAALLFACIGTLEAADSQSLEACTKYAEADHTYDEAIQRVAPLIHGQFTIDKDNWEIDEDDAKMFRIRMDERK